MGDIHIENMFARKSAIRRRGETLVKYTEASGLDDWIGNISGIINGYYGNPKSATTQIPNVQSAKEIEIGCNVTSLQSCAFYNCSGLTSLVIPNSVTNIYVQALWGCSGLTNLVIPNSVTSIVVSAFHGCSGLTSVTIGSGVSTIQSDVFNNCNRCITFDFRRATHVLTLNNVSAFQNTPANKEIIVPDALYDDWIVATNWSSDTNNIRPCIVKASQSSLGLLT